MSPCSAYAVALDAEKTMTSPIPTSAATTAKSTASGAAATYDCTGARSLRRLRANAAPLRTGRLPKLRNRCDETLAAILGRAEHVERRAARRKQHNVTRLRKIARAPYGVFHRRRARRHGRLARLDDLGRCFADRDEC